MDKIVDKQPHQNVIIKAEPIKYIRTSSSDILSGRMIVFLDRLTDPQNFGAIIRTCQYLGVDHIIVDELFRCPLNPTVSKTSAGALEVMDIYCTPNPISFLEGNQIKVLFKKQALFHKDCQNHGWKVYSTGLTHKSNQISLEKLKVSHKDKIVIVMGNEGTGVDPKIMEKSDKIVFIDQQVYLNRALKFPDSLVDSLNVNSAASIIIQSLKLKMVNSEALESKI